MHVPILSWLLFNNARPPHFIPNHTDSYPTLCSRGLYCAAHLGMFYLKLSHLYEVLPEGHDTPALETGEFYEDKIVLLKKHSHSAFHFFTQGNEYRLSLHLSAWMNKPFFPDSESLSNFCRQCCWCSSAWGMSLLFSRALSRALLEFS